MVLLVFFFSRMFGNRKAVSRQKGETWGSWKKLDKEEIFQEKMELKYQDRMNLRFEYRLL